MARSTSSPIRFAVVGQGYFAQAAVLPAFRRAEGAELAALVSDDQHKLDELGERYGVALRCRYDDYDELLASGRVDAVYIALPNDMHCEYTLRAARNRVHVLCEKPMAPSVAECEEMIAACRQMGVQLMVGYRLHFEAGNLTAIEIAHEGEIGEPRIFSSVFSMQVRPGNTRLQAARAGGPLNDIGIYCINAARYIFGAEPLEAIAFMGVRDGDPRFREVEESVAAILRFDGDRVASFTASFGAADVARYEVVGTRGALVVDNAYEWTTDIQLAVTLDGKSRHRTFRKRDQVAAELVYFSRCIQSGVTPEPSGWEGLADVRVMEAIREAARTGSRVAIEPVEQMARPDLTQDIRVKAHREAPLVKAAPPSGG